MFIKKLNIKNFKCFKDKTFDNIGLPNGEKGSGLNILIGENGNGKTAILEAINYLTLSSYSVENKLDINDFTDFSQEIGVIADINDFRCKSSIDYYSEWYFLSDGIEFTAKSRKAKERNKMLSSTFDTHSYFKLKSQYLDKDGNPKKDVDSRDKIFNNSYISNDAINIFYFDKNRSRQVTTGTYKTTFERILDDLNWRFRKNLNEDGAGTIIDNISGEYFQTIETITESSAGTKTANELKDFFGNTDYKNLKIELVSLLAPFTNAFFAIRKDDDLKQIAIRSLGSGIEIVLTLLLLKNIAGASKGKVIYLIDEPELHLHPKAQEKLLDLLLEESKGKQIFTSTHSPYMFKGSIGQGANLFLLKKDDENNIEIVNTRNEGWGLFGEISPTWGEINWFAYDLPTVEFHNELYGFIQAKAINEDENNERQSDFDEWLERKGLERCKDWIRESAGVVKPPEKATNQTYIRNSIHHPENRHNEDYSNEELKNSIHEMIGLLKAI